MGVESHPRQLCSWIGLEITGNSLNQWSSWPAWAWRWVTMKTIGVSLIISLALPAILFCPNKLTTWKILFWGREFRPTSLEGLTSGPTWFVAGGPSGISKDVILSSGGGLGGKTEVSNLFNSVSSFGVMSPPTWPLGELGIFSTPVLSEMLSEGTFIRREILTLGALTNRKNRVSVIFNPEKGVERCSQRLVVWKPDKTRTIFTESYYILRQT